MTKTISGWERFKRIVAHSFELKTKLEMEEERLARKRQEVKEEAERFLAQRTAELEVEYEQQLFKARQEDFKRRMAEQAAEAEAKRKAEEEAKRQEAIRLHRENKWYEAFNSKQSDNIEE